MHPSTALSSAFLPHLTTIFHAVVFASALSGCAVVGVLGVRLALRRALSPSWRAALWLPVVVLAVLPRLRDPGWGWNLEQHPSPPAHSEPAIQPTSPRVPASDGEVTETVPPAAIKPVENHPGLEAYAALAWAFGAVAFPIFWLAGYATLWRRIRREKQPTPGALANVVAECGRTVGLRRTPRLIVTGAIASPAVAGLIRPVVLMPSSLVDTLGARDLRHVLLHEAAHLKRGDLLLHWFSALLVALHWFNPLFWFAARLCRADRESACDAAVLSICHNDARRDYADTLLMLESRLPRPLVGMLGSADLVRRRILDIARFGHRSRIAGWSAALVATIIGAALAVSAAEPPLEKPAKEEAAPKIKSQTSVEPLPPLEDTLRRIDELAGAVEKQIIISTKIVTLEPSEDLPEGIALPKADISTPPAQAKPAGVPAPGIFALTGVLTDPQYQVVIRSLAQKKSAKLTSLPNVTTRSGQKATIESVREFIYPTEFDPPQMGKSTVRNQPPAVTPTTPTAFEMKPIGVRIEVVPTIGPDGSTLELGLTPTLTSFSGFINYGSPITTTARDEQGRPIVLTLSDNRILQPVFNTAKVNTAVTIWDGQTVILGGEWSVASSLAPEAAELPDAKNAHREQVLIFVTAKMIDPAGRAGATSRGIVLDEVKISDAGLADAVSRISELCQQYDARKGHPGINLILRHPDQEPPRVSLHVRDVKASEVLGQLAEAAGLDLKVEGSAVLLMPKAQ